MSFIPYGRQHVTDADVAAVTEVLRSDWLTQGPIVPRFEAAVARHCGVAHALAVNSATSALHIGCLALGLGPGDWLWTSPITFVASANCALYCGARVDFVDIDPATCNISVGALERKLIAAQASGRLPKIVVAVHLRGESCDMAGISALAKRFGFRVIEDASHAIGGKYRNEPVGNCRFSDLAVFSFHPVKIVTTAEGGMLVTDDAALAERVALLRSHGITRDPRRMSKESEGDWYYEQIELGYNYRMTELQGALGLSQIERLAAYVTRRHELSHRYDGLLVGLPLDPVGSNPDSYSALHLYVIRLRLAQLRKTRRDLFDALRSQGIGVNVHYIPVHLQPYYSRFGFAAGQFPEAERYYAEAITLPLYPGLDEAAQDKVVAVLRQVVGA
jgi:UDP-4-amino-4,6-dideoxy-N-acetyl-beta-L-altrosamine transaminase